MTDENQHEIGVPDRKYHVFRETVMLNQERGRMRVMQTLYVSHEQQDGKKSVCINRPTLLSLIEYERNNRAEVLTPDALNLLDYLDIFTGVGFAIGSETEFYIRPSNSVEAELFDEAAALAAEAA